MKNSTTPTTTAPVPAVVEGPAPPPPAETAAPPVARAKRSRTILVKLAIGWLAVVVLLAVFADLLPIPGYDVRIGRPAMGPSWDLASLLGTDGLGRSTLSRLIYGARVSLAVGVVSVLIGMVIGGVLGLLAGYLRGGFEKVVTILTDSLLAYPPLVLLLAITSTLGSSLRSLVISLGLLCVPTFTRLARANTLAFAQREFVTASRALGGRPLRIIFREILPNVVLPVASYAFVMAAVVIVAEGSLSFLGLGIPPPSPSWGGMISAAKDRLATQPHLVFIPAAAMFLTIFALNVVGDRARTRFDVRESAL
ncbi:ABC transporter permease [Pseudonocardia oroxyli]|uniref:Peptide/nickel transport system permease protein n=1 Tax=Pseudonocardia oroxyli TaxID=366584 RepID=A0A1G7TRM5_PSEOR|nr:ABC transporter permease [Pseudonocardia oroxyli]SDG37918.1 peptide/nickel transport system permease protein [Pseudonocardia oroxyli]